MKTCPPCNERCSQGRTCPTRMERAWSGPRPRWTALALFGLSAWAAVSLVVACLGAIR